MSSSDEPKKKDPKITIVDFNTFTEYDYICQAAFYFKDALGQIIMIHNSKRDVCQAWVDENYGKDKYKVIASRMSKTKSSLESGGLSCTGTSSRKGQKK